MDNICYVICQAIYMAIIKPPTLQAPCLVVESFAEIKSMIFFLYFLDRPRVFETTLHFKAGLTSENIPHLATSGTFKKTCS